ncbi:MAG: hypothetical protein ACE5KA_05765 [Nitrososphaerales archaeon]
MGYGFPEGYIGVPDGHNKVSGALQSLWKDSLHIQRLYFVTATFSSESRSFFPNHSNHYLFATFSDRERVINDLSECAPKYMSFLFPTKSSLFERPSMAKLNYVSVYYIKQSYNGENVRDLKDVFLRKRDRLRSATVADIEVVPDSSLKFTFPYSSDLLLLELESEKSHQSDQKYCERTRNEVIRKGINVNNLVSFSVLSELK